MAIVINRAPLRIGLIDMNNGLENQAIRCFRGIIDQFVEHVRESNPLLQFELSYVQPRNKDQAPPRGCDLYFSSGGPGGPFDGEGESWLTAYNEFLDYLLDEQAREGDAARAMFGVCYSFELLVTHLGVGEMTPRDPRKFGIMPVYMTEAGMKSPLLEAFGDRLFAWEHRSWQAVNLDEKRLNSLGGELWARESRDGISKGESMLSFRFAPNIEGTLFHPEADRAGALAWIARPDQAEAVIEAYGETTYLRMLKTLDDPSRLARTRAIMIPHWLERRFNQRAELRGWNPVSTPPYDEAKALLEFGLPPGGQEPGILAGEAPSDGN